MFKKILISLLSLCALIASACFLPDIDSILDRDPIIIIGPTGEVIKIDPPGEIVTPDIPIPDVDAQYFEASFPYSLSIAFSGFTTDTGEVDQSIDLIEAYYFDKKGGWTLLRRVANPRFKVVSDSPIYVLGRHSVPSSMGYSEGEILPIVVYFRSSSGAESFDRARFLDNRKSLITQSGCTVIGFVVMGNRVAF